MKGIRDHIVNDLLRSSDLVTIITSLYRLGVFRLVCSGDFVSLELDDVDGGCSTFALGGRDFLLPVLLHLCRSETYGSSVVGFRATVAERAIYPCYRGRITSLYCVG
jgi:hypothetical protein